jgi:hypothetical protein
MMRAWYILSTCGILVLLLSACEKPSDGPDLNETITWMQRALAEHNGQRIDNTISSEVKIIAKLTADHCKLSYELSDYDVVGFDLADIDPNSIKTEKIGNAVWATFKNRDYHHSTHYTHPKDPTGFKYDGDTGGFSLDSQEVATSFSKALSRAVRLCGGKPSTF